MDTRIDKLKSDKDQIYAFADKQAHSTDDINLSPESGGGLALPEDRIAANLQDSTDWDKQQNRRDAGRMEEDGYPEF